MTTKHNRVLSTGVTGNLEYRVSIHKKKSVEGFTKRYNVTKLVYHEMFEGASEAIARENQIKGGSRQKKIDLVNAMNPEWKDLFDEL